MLKYHPVAHSSLPVILAMMFAAEVLTAQQPFMRFGLPADEASDTLHWYTGAHVWLKVFAGPAGVSLSSPQNVEITSIDSNAGGFLVLLRDPKPGINRVCITAAAGGESVSECIVIIVEEPELQGGIEQWGGLRAVIGRKYNPSSEWNSSGILIDDYHTVVYIDNDEVLSRAGTSFTDRELPTVGEYTWRIETVVYWKPNGTTNENDWIPLLSNQPDSDSRVQLGDRRMQIRYATPEQVEGFEFDWVLDPSLSPVEFEPIVLRQMIGPKHVIIPLPMEASCEECSSYGISAQLLPGLESSRLRLEVIDSSKFARVPNGKRLDVEISMRGRGGVVGSGRVGITIHLPGLVASNFNDRVGKSPTDSDRAGTEAIRALLQFKERAVSIYAIEGDALQRIITSIQAADSGDYYGLDTLVADLVGESPSNFATLVLLIARRWIPSYQNFETSLLSNLGVDFEDLDVEKVRRIYRLALSIIERHDLRPTRFYLVTTSDPQPKALALLGTKRDESGNTIVVPSIEAPSMWVIFDGIARKWFSTLEQGLAVKSPTREAARNAPLRQVWPEAPQGR